jgi:hypothetical protein
MPGRNAIERRYVLTANLRQHATFVRPIPQGKAERNKLPSSQIRAHAPRIGQPLRPPKSAARKSTMQEVSVPAGDANLLGLAKPPSISSALAPACHLTNPPCGRREIVLTVRADPQDGKVTARRRSPSAGQRVPQRAEAESQQEPEKKNGPQDERDGSGHPAAAAWAVDQEHEDDDEDD